MIKISHLLLFLSCMLSTNSTKPQQQSADTFSWARVAELPVVNGADKSFGVAGAFAGISNNVLIVAGGANFPEGMPWMGGRKVYHDEIYVLERNPNGQYAWLNSITSRLKNKLAYGASVSIPDGIVCIGGENESGFSDEVFLIKWNTNQKNIVFRSLPNLPIALANACATHIGNCIYVSGGEDADRALDNFFALDLDDLHPQWKSLPAVPLAMSNSVAISLPDDKGPCIYIVGGRSKTLSGISKLHNTVFRYEPVNKRWKRLAPISDGKHTINLSAGTGFAIDENKILLTGGDRGDIFNRLEKLNVDIAKSVSDRKRRFLEGEKLKILSQHPGFSRVLLMYNSLTDSWSKLGELPFPAQVTTMGVKWDDDMVIPSGEIQPGIRTPYIILGKIISRPSS